MLYSDWEKRMENNMDHFCGTEPIFIFYESEYERVINAEKVTFLPQGVLAVESNKTATFIPYKRLRKIQGTAK